MAKKDIRIETAPDVGYLVHTLMDNVFPRKETALRELVQNAMGAGASEVWFWLGKSDYGEGPNDVSCVDNGCGMDVTEAENDLCRIGAGKNPMGRFGLGFLSCFALSEKATVFSVKTPQGGSGVSGVELQLVRQTDQTGQRPSTTIAGTIEDGVTAERLSSCGLLAPSGAQLQTGTKVVLRNPTLQSGNSLEQLAQKPDRVRQVLDQWCRYIDPNKIRIFLNGAQINEGMRLANETVADMDQEIAYRVPGTALTKTAKIKGCVTFSGSTSVALLEYGIFVCWLSNVSHPGIQQFHNSVSCVQALLDCDQFTLNVARDHVDPNAALLTALTALKATIEAQLVPALVRKIVANAELSKEEAAYAKQRILLAIKMLEAVEDKADLKAMSAVPVFTTISGQQVSLMTLLAAAGKQHRIYFASGRDSAAERVAARNNLVLLRQDIPDVDAFRRFLTKRGAELVDVATLTSVIDCSVTPESELSAHFREFLAECRTIDTAVHLGEVRDWCGDILADRVGYYDPKTALIVLNTRAERVQRALSSDSPFRSLLVLPTIAHERTHEKVKGHGEEFLKALEIVLDEKCQALSDALSRDCGQGNSHDLQNQAPEGTARKLAAPQR